MGYVNQFILFFCVFLLTSSLVAQNDFIEVKDNITSSALRLDSKQLVFTTSKYMYIVDVDSFQVSDSIPLHQRLKYSVNDLEYISSESDVILAKDIEYSSYGYPRLTQEFFEYPQDSTFAYNLKEKKKLAVKIPGNTYLAYSTDTLGSYVFAYNDYFEYKDDYGNLNKGSKKGMLIFYPKKNKMLANGIIKKLKITPSNKEIAVVNYDSLINGNYHYTLELRKLPSLVLKKSVSFIGKPKKIRFSKNSKYLAVIKQGKFSKNETIDFYTTENLILLKKIPKDLFVEGLVSNKKVWKMMDGEVVNYDLGLDKKLINIWPNLTPMSNINGFYKINENQLILYGGGSNLTQAKAGFYKYSLKDNAVYSNVVVAKNTDTLYNPLAINIKNNVFTGENVQVSLDQTLLMAQSNKQLQFWELPTRRKLRDVMFENEMHAFLNPNGNEVLIFEKVTNKRFDDFIMKVLDVSTGIVTTKSFIENSYPFLDPTSNSCNCTKIKNQDWICTDSSALLWEINTSNFTINEHQNFKDDSFYRSSINRFVPINDTTLLLQILNENVAANHSVTESELKDVTTYNIQTKKKNTLKGLNTAVEMIPVSSNTILYRTNKSVKVFDLQTQYSTEIHNFKKDTEVNLLNGEKFAYAIIGKSFSTDSLDVLQIDTALKKIKKKFKIPSSSGYFVTNDEINFSVYNTSNKCDELKTFYPKYNSITDWEAHEKLSSSISNFEVDKTGFLLYNNEWLINLKTLETERGFLSYKNVTLLNENQVLYSNLEDNKLQFIVANYDSLEVPIWKSKRFKFEGYSASLKVIVSLNNDYALLYDDSALNSKVDFFIIDLKNGIVKTQSTQKPISSGGFFVDNSKFFIVSGKSYSKNLETNIYDINSLNKTTILQDIDPVFIDEKKFIQIDYQSVAMKKLEDNQVSNIKKYYARDYLRVCLYIDSYQYIVAGSDSGNIYLWTLDNQSPLKRIPVGTSNIISIKSLGDKLYVLLENSEIKIINLNTLVLDVTLSLSEKEKVVSLAWFTPDGFFKASKQNIRDFHFVKDSKAFPLLNFELFLNRPDVLLKKTGFSDAETIKTYKKAYLKRLKRNGFTEQTDYLNMERPVVSLLNRTQIPAVSKSNDLKLEIELSSNIKEVSVYINGVPVSKRAEPISNKLNEHIILNPGQNDITIEAVNNEGVKSDPVTVKVTNIQDKRPSKVYYIGIGVSKYADSTMNLNYADKDVRSLTKLFTNKFEGRIVIDTLTNNRVTKVNLRALKAKLEETDVNDIVIISFSGHGLVDDNYDFYFATHDIEFDKPQVNGFSYQDIQDLLNDIPARKKLLLLDACHSGEIDNPEDLERVAIDNKNVKQHTPKGSIGVKSKNNKKGLQNSFELMQSLFYDLDRGNGSFIISAAGGKEFAFESEDLKNGVFTYSFIKAINTLNGKGIKISDLKKEIYKRVKTLTNNQQKPTSRSENIEWDWILE